MSAEINLWAGAGSPPRPEATRLIARGAARLMRSLGCAVVAEMTFANGRRADLVALSGAGEVTVIEVKSGLLDYRTDGKWLEYKDFCDRFCFAVGPDFPLEVLPADVGIIVADGFGGHFVAGPSAHPLVAARRKAVTLAFARLAAARLHGLVDPYCEG